ncbi:hypothetical protein WN55_08192 [Dufourea novaeangliae]|uniref:Uncharacterized protein n=1 Tax=Dufourea novaeangliae TaxID=178035 RepID=A0A154P4T3_DUFNO|nr:hypothetical protein WN55_08192 [Dufourea novaeangliae]
MHYQQYVSLCLVGLVLGQAASLPQHPQYSQQIEHRPREDRKFAEKPNAMKKVAIDDLNEVGTNQIQEGNGGSSFSWSNMLGVLMRLLLGRVAGDNEASKNEIAEDGVPASPWANAVAVGLRVITALIGGPQHGDIEGIDKVSHDGSPMQFIGIVVNLLDALKTSFSHRSFTARSAGRRDTVSEAAVASITMLKGYMRSLKTFSNVGRAEEEGQQGCAERALCEASAECAADAQGTTSIFCQLGSYTTSYILQMQSGIGFETLYEAGRRGRTGQDCRTLFLDCNAV